MGQKGRAAPGDTVHPNESLFFADEFNVMKTDREVHLIRSGWTVSEGCSDSISSYTTC